jgi:hypothetical protein
MAILTQPWWYYALCLLSLAVFACICRLSVLNGKHLPRRIQIVTDRAERKLEDLYWEHLREYEAIIARTLTVQRAIREHPERVAALLSEDVSFGDVIDAVAS